MINLIVDAAIVADACMDKTKQNHVALGAPGYRADKCANTGPRLASGHSGGTSS